MSRLLTILIALAALLAVPPRFPKAAGPTYYPTRVGAKWVYQYSGGGELVKTVTKVETENGAKVVFVGEVGKDGAVTHNVTMRVSPDGLFLLEMGYAPGLLDPPLCELRLPHKDGDTWEVGPYERDSSLPAEKYEFTSRGSEVVTVPAGTFNALRVEQNRILTGGAAVWRYTTWYAPGVGMVKLVSDRDDGHRRRVKQETVLKSFTPGER